MPTGGGNSSYSLAPESPFGAADTGTIGICFPKAVLANTLSLKNVIFFCRAASLSSGLASGKCRSILLRATIIEEAQNSNYPTTMHSAV